MLQMGFQQQSNAKHVPFWVKVLASIIYAIGAVVVFSVMGFVSGIHSGYAAIILTVISIALGIVLPHLPYKDPYHALVAPLAILFFWFVAMGFLNPSIAKEEYQIRAAWLVPPYPYLKLEQAGAFAGAFEENGGISYNYHSTNLKEDYSKMRDFYTTELGKKGWVEFTVGKYNTEYSDKVDYGGMTFWQQTKDSTRINVYYDNRTSSVGVGVSF